MALQQEDCEAHRCKTSLRPKTQDNLSHWPRVAKDQLVLCTGTLSTITMRHVVGSHQGCDQRGGWAQGDALGDV